MNKLFTKIAGLTLGLAMAIGVGVAIGNNANFVKVKADTPDETLTVSTTDQISPKTNGTGVSELTMGDTTVSFTDGSNTPTRYWNGEIRSYIGGGSMSFDAGSKTLKKIVLTGAKITGFSVDVGTYTSGTGTWEGDSSTVTFTVTATVQIASISIYYKGATAYISELTVTHNESATSLNVTAEDAIDTSVFTIGGTRSSGNITSSDYEFLGSGVLENSTFTPSSTTQYAYGDNRLCWRSKLDTSSSDTTKQVAYFPITVAALQPSYSLASTASVEKDKSITLTATVNSAVDTSKIVWSKEAGEGGDASNINLSNASGASVTVSGVTAGKATVVFTYDNDTANAKRCVVTVTKAAVYTLVDDATELTPGTRFMLLSERTISSTTYRRAATSTFSSKYLTATTDFSLTNGFNAGSVATSPNGGAGIFTLEGYAGNWFIKSGNNYMNFTGTSNGSFAFNEKQNTNSYKFTIVSDGLTTLITDKENSRQFRYSIDTQNANNYIHRFGNYNVNASNPAVYMFADIAEVTYGTTQRIEVSTYPQLAWHSGQTFATTGMVVTGFDENENSKTLASNEYSVSGVTIGTVFADSHIGQRTVTISCAGCESVSFNIDVYAAATYQLVTSAPEKWDGQYLIVGTVPNESATEKMPAGDYALQSTLTNYAVEKNYTPVSVSDSKIVAGQELEFTIASVENNDGKYSLKSKTNKYIGWDSGSSNGITTSNSALLNTITINGSNVTIAGAGGRVLSVGSSNNDMKYYQNGTVKLYKLVPSDTAISFANSFLTTVTCSGEGTDGHITDENIATDWVSLRNAYNAMGVVDKEFFRLGVANESGNAIERCLARYDYIIKKYNTSSVTTYEEFMHRIEAGKISYDSYPVSPLGISDGNNVMITIILIASLASLTAIAGFVILRKRKEQ